MIAISPFRELRAALGRERPCPHLVFAALASPWPKGLVTATPVKLTARFDTKELLYAGHMGPGTGGGEYHAAQCEHHALPP